jgi:hypothetical protein
MAAQTSAALKQALNVTTTAPVNPGFRLEKSESLPLTLEFAQRFKEMTPSATERPRNEGRVEHLREKAQAGLLLPFHWAQAKLRGKMYRVNGQHSSEMLCGLDGAFPEKGLVHLDTYEVDSEDALALLFRQIDDRRSSRTGADVSEAYRGIHPELQDISAKVAKLGAESINWFHRYVEGVPSLSGDDVYSLFSDKNIHPFLKWLSGELFNIKTPELARKAIVAAIYGTFVANETEAKKFWLSVARGGVEFDETAPATALDNWLRTAAENPRRSREDLKDGNYYQGCVYCWNGHRESRAISTVKFDVKRGFSRITE